jgi:hypothetical protein
MEKRDIFGVSPNNLSRSKVETHAPQAVLVATLSLPPKNHIFVCFLRHRAEQQGQTHVSRRSFAKMPKIKQPCIGSPNVCPKAFNQLTKLLNNICVRSDQKAHTPGDFCTLLRITLSLQDV